MNQLESTCLEVVELLPKQLCEKIDANDIQESQALSILLYENETQSVQVVGSDRRELVEEKSMQIVRKIRKGT